MTDILNKYETVKAEWQRGVDDGLAAALKALGGFPSWDAVMDALDGVEKWRQAVYEEQRLRAKDAEHYQERIRELEAALAARVVPTNETTAPMEKLTRHVNLDRVEGVRKRAMRILRLLETTPWNKLHDASKTEYLNGYRWKNKHDIILVPIDKRRQNLLALRERSRGGPTVLVAVYTVHDLGTLTPEAVPTIAEVSRG